MLLTVPTATTSLTRMDPHESRSPFKGRHHHAPNYLKGDTTDAHEQNKACPKSHVLESTTEQIHGGVMTPDAWEKKLAMLAKDSRRLLCVGLKKE